MTGRADDRRPGMVRYANPACHKMKLHFPMRRSCISLLSWLIAFGPAVLAGDDAKPGGAAARPPVVLTPEAIELHRSALLWDGHNDLPWAIREQADPEFARIDIAQPQAELHTDIPRLRKGNVGAQFWSAYVPAETGPRGEALRTTLEQIELIHRMVKRYPDAFEMAATADDVERIHRAGKIASLIGIEGGHSIENSLANLKRLYDLGARYMTLTHTDSLDWADSGTDEAKSGGLSEFGEDVVREMNRLGMLVDLSHVSVDTMKDALRITTAPIIFSHSSANGVAAHPRNVPDDVLKLTAENGGLVMVNFYSGFVVPESAKTSVEMFGQLRELRGKFPNVEDFRKAWAEQRDKYQLAPGTIHDLVDHIDHIVKVAGVDHVGLGSDFDGVGMLPAQLEDVATYPYVTQELLNRGYAAADIRKILGGNMLRVLRAAERSAEAHSQE